MISTRAEFDEIFHQLEGDLRALFKLVFTHKKPVAESDLLLASVILRKWLLQGLLGRLCNTARIEASVYVLDNSAALAELQNQPSINYFLTGGVKFNGAPFSGTYKSSLPYEGKHLIPVATMPERELKISEFLAQKRLFFEGTYFSCEDIIKFTANKAGGAHFDKRMDPHFEKLARAAQYMKYGGPEPSARWDPGCEIYMVLEPNSTEILSALHVEIIAAATSFVQLHFNDTPLLILKHHTSMKTKLKRALGLNKARLRVFEQASVLKGGTDENTSSNPTAHQTSLSTVSPKL